MKDKLPQLKNIIVLRSFAIIAVVLYHCYCPWLYAWNWYSCPIRGIYSFIFETVLVGRMPLFVFVSGYLFSHLYNDRGKYQSFKQFLLNKIKRLLIPCLLFTVLMSFCLQENYLQLVIGNGHHLWFLKMLFLCFITCWIYARYIRNVSIELILLLVSIGIMCIPAPGILGINQYCKYYIFFYGGYLFYKYRKSLKFLFSKSFVWTFIILYLILCLICFLIYYDNSQLALEDIIHSNKLISLIRLILRPLMVLITFIIVEKIIQRGLLFEKLFIKLNKLSYGIYLFHVLLLQIIYKYFYPYTIDYAEEHYILLPLLYFFINISICIFITMGLKRTKWGIYLIG